MFSNVYVNGKASVYHAAIVLFLEFFAFGLLFIPMMDVLEETFKDQMYLINGLVQGVKGLLSFLSAPLLGALSDAWGRKPFLLLTVFVTCAPIPLLTLNPWWFFAMLSVSGTCSVTFSIVFAYVADITDEAHRSSAYGLVSATFAASIVTSPAIGFYLSQAYGKAAVVALATVIAAFDLCFILLFVPESLPEHVLSKSWDSQIAWEQADPFASLKKVGQDSTLLLLCTTVFLSYLPEAGQYAFVFLYVEQIIGFSKVMVVSYIAAVGILSIATQTAILGVLYKFLGNRSVILLGLTFQIGQLLFFAFGKAHWTMWTAGALAALSSLNYPALSSFVSTVSSKDQQGAVQGMVNGIRGLCNGLGPALFGLIFHIFHVELKAPHVAGEDNYSNNAITGENPSLEQTILPGPPYLFGVFTVILAVLIACFIPKNIDNKYRLLSTKDVSSVTDHCKLNSSTSRTQKKLGCGKLSDSDDQSMQKNVHHEESLL